MALQPLPTDFELTVPGNQKIEGDALIERHLHVVQTANVAGRLTVADTIDATGGGLLTNNLQLSLIDVDASQWPRLSANLQRQVELQGSLQVTTDVTIEGAFTGKSSATISGSLQVGGGMAVSGVLDVTEIRKNGQPLIGSRWDAVGDGIHYSRGNVGIGAVNPQMNLDVSGQGLFRSASWHGPVAGLAGAVIGFDAAHEGGTGFLFAHAENKAATRLWLDGNPLIFAPASVERMRVDSKGNIGIGTKQPVTALEIVKDWTGEEGALRLTGDKPTIRFSGGAVSGNQSWLLHLGSHGPGNLGFYRRTGPSGWNHVLSLTPGDNVGIGTITPGAKLHVAGDLRVDGNIIGHIDRLHSGNGQYVLVMQNDRNLVLYHNGVGAVWASNTGVSDSRLKQDLQPIGNALERLRAVRGISFAWKDETIREREFGVVAQELEQVFPELVYSIEEHKLVKYHGLIPVLIEAFKTQQDLLTNLSAEVRSLQQQLLQGEHHAAKY